MSLSEQQKKEIIEQQSQKKLTNRVISPELEKILYEAVPVLDHGFSWGGKVQIVTRCYSQDLWFLMVVKIQKWRCI